MKENSLALQSIPVPEAVRRIADSKDRKLAWAFFVSFSRMEYALKRSGIYLKAGTDKAEANWDKFAGDHNDLFSPESSQDLADAVDYFRANPPRKQLNNGGAIGWSDPQSYDGKEPLLVWLLRVIRYVRNNLFHGGKFPRIPIDEPSRDRELLRHSMVVLSACVPVGSAAKTFFEDDETGKP